MLPDEYERQVSAAAVPAMALAHQLLSAIRPNPMTDADWLAFLQAIFSVVRNQAMQAARLAREFYDSERQRQVPGVPMNPVNLAQLSFENFVRDMEPARKLASKPDFSPDLVVARVARTVENGARRTMIRAVENPDPDLDPHVDNDVVADPDKPPEPKRSSKDKQAAQLVKLVKGWARVPTGRETCGFCWMLASRGPVYTSSGTAGAKGSQKSVIRKVADGSFSSDDMDKWHPGCDCKVVPVFKLDDWAGKDKYEAAWKVWKDEIQGKYSGKDALNEYRRLVERGEIQKILSGIRRAA